MLVLLLVLTACAPRDQARHRTAPDAVSEHRLGDEIVVAGKLFHTGAPVVLWSDEGGYNAYRTDRRFARPGGGTHELDNALRYGSRAIPGDPGMLGDLRRHIDQFVIHYDAAGNSRQCFKILHDVRGLSCHFLLDIDGTIYQTLDLKERAWHATIANDRSVGIEIANIGAYPVEAFVGDAAGRPDGPLSITTPMIERSPLADFYAHDKLGPFLTTPAWQGDGGVRTPGFVGRPARDRPVVREVQGQALVQYDLTPEQYDSLGRLIRTLCDIFPAMRADFPKDPSGNLLRRALTPEEFASFRGVLGHYHVQQNKIDPGPAFDWDRVLGESRNDRRYERR